MEATQAVQNPVAEIVEVFTPDTLLDDHLEFYGIGRIP